MSKVLLGIVIVCAAAFVFVISGSWSQVDLQSMSSWHVSIDRKGPKGKNEYDVIVVGAGFGGLSCGSFLAKNGYKVLVLEKNRTLGGLCSSYEDNGYHFCYGAEDISGLGDRGPVSYLLRELGIDRSALFVPNTHTFLDGLRPVYVPAAPGAFEQVMLETYPKEKDAVQKFFTKARSVYEEGYDAEMIKNWGVLLPTEVVPKVMPEEWIASYKEKHQNYLEWSSRPYQEVLDEYFSEPGIKTLLCGFVTYLGSKPYNTPASAVVLNSFGFFFDGSFQVLGTPEKFANILASYITFHGGAVIPNQTVNKILIGQGVVQGVQVGETVYHAPVVVCNVNAKTAYFEMIDQNDLPSDFLKDLWALPLGNSAFALHLAVDNVLSSYPSILQDGYNHVYVSIPTKNDSSLAPAGHSIVILRETVRFSSFIYNSKEETERYIQDRTEKLMEKGVKLIPELAKGTIIRRVVTPYTFAELANVPYGAIFGFDTIKSEIKPYFRAPVRGLYMSNASSGGPGVDTVVKTGLTCGHDIMGWAHEKAQAPGA